MTIEARRGCWVALAVGLVLPWSWLGRGVAAAQELASARAGPSPSPEESVEAAWQRFPVFVWFHGGPPPGPAAFAVLREHGLDGCNIEGSGSSAAAARAGMRFYVDHAAGKGDLFLRPVRFDADRERLKQELLGFEPVRPNCFNDPAVVARLRSLLTASVERHRAHAPLCYVLDDELSITRGVNPMDYCFGPECLAALRAWLRVRYGSLAALNATWGTGFRDFDLVRPPTTEAARRAAAGRPIEQVNLAAWNDHRAFMDESFAHRVRELCDLARGLDPTTPVGFTGGQFPSAFGGFDWPRLVAGVTAIEAYETGRAPELVRTFAGAGTKVVATLFVPEVAAARERWSPWELVARAARGDDGAVIWASGAIFTESGQSLNEAGRELAAAVAAARNVKRQLVELGAKPVEPEVLLVHSAASVRAGWLVDSWGDGRTWPNRLTSYEAEHSSSVAGREAWASALAAVGLPFGFVDSRDLAADPRVLARARALVLTGALALSDGEVAALQEFDAAGTVIGDERTLLFDEHLRGRDSAALAALLGLKRAAGLTLDDLAAGEGGRARALARLTAQGIAQLRSLGVVSPVTLASAAPERARLHRFQATCGEVALVVATGGPAASDVALEFSLAADVDWLLPGVASAAEPHAVAGVKAVRELRFAVDPTHPALLCWQRAR